MASGYLAVAAAAVCLPGADGLADLRADLLAAREFAGTVRRVGAGQAGLVPVDARVGLCADRQPTDRQATDRQPTDRQATDHRPAEDRRPPSAAARLAGLPRESRLAVRVAAEALAASGSGTAGQGVGVVWVSSTAGLEEYGQICAEAATLDPGHASPLMAPQSAYNGPAAAVSIRLHLTGPHLTLTGDRDAGGSALVEAGRLLAEGRCRQVLVGGSASVGGWRLAGTAPAGARDTVPVEGAVCLLLSRQTGQARQGGARALRRAHLRSARYGTGQPPAGTPEAFVGDCLALMQGPPDAVALSAVPAWRAPVGRAVRASGAPCWPVERTTGDLEAAGGLVAAVAALAGCAPAPAGISRVLALAVGGAGDAVAVEIVSRDVVAREREDPDESL